MAHAWNACWVNALGGSNPPFSAGKDPAPVQPGAGSFLLRSGYPASSAGTPGGGFAWSPASQGQAYDAGNQLCAEPHRRRARDPAGELPARKFLDAGKGAGTAPTECGFRRRQATLNRTAGGCIHKKPTMSLLRGSQGRRPYVHIGGTVKTACGDHVLESV
jgi:hypothetical protein